MKVLSPGQDNYQAMKEHSMRKLLAVLALVFPLALLTACEQEGPLEQAGEEADQAVEDTGDAIDDATEN
jgi:predicted small lipoprotein YifL